VAADLQEKQGALLNKKNKTFTKLQDKRD